MNRKWDWLRQAELDLKAAGDLLASRNFAWACFTSQQCAEKAFKATLFHLGKPVLTHNIVDMLKALTPHLSVPLDVVKAGNTLNRYYIPTRYPGAFSSGAPGDQYFEPEAKEATELARVVHDFARSTLGPAGPSTP